jgi:hypothetical protein
LSLALPPPRRRGLVVPLLLVVVASLVVAHWRINPGLSLARLYPPTGITGFLAAKEGRVAGLGHALPPNAAMVYGLADVRGDDPVKLARYERVYATLAPTSPVYFQPIDRWNEPWLDRLGVRWVVAGPGAAPPVPAWSLTYEGPDGRVYERSTASPIVRWEHGGTPRIVERAPGRWDIRWETGVAGRLLVAETWDRGWQARLDGRVVPLDVVDGVLMAVTPGPGAGRLVLAYRPFGFGAAVSISVGATLLLLVSAVIERLHARSESPMVR